MTPRQVARQILMRPAAEGGHYFNGIRSLERAAASIFPGLQKLDPRLRDAFMGLLRKELGLTARIPPCDHLELVAA
ncbi:hypothetical protein CKO35_15770 [Ectothiorhodospira shaposhnikovii]|uniref:hypothetical protein n=1 Tax=Ectothiorhodospira shaposhnikovii TaxID=1054 RepID=UPI001905907E|nr:hypothetical protein [Ectothiorhodospira shaposhnikovii]MBK1674722.1 hypothetical protein [Ectothiorhodospira shaposhnikovii]